MSSSLLPIQQAIYNRLTGDSVLMAKVTGVFDYVSDNQAFPYITIGEATSNPFRTFSRFGEEVTVTLHIWSRYDGSKEALEILNEMNRLLADQDLAVTGYDTVACFYEFSETLRDPDGITRHLVVRYRIITQKQ
jgi:Protein of unknown function (DUF3168)